MIINIEKTLGCDNLSQAYRDAYNSMHPLLVDNDKIKQLSVVDLSALALYLGKFAEQEINSSIVQLMRQICGVDMPEYYCKFCPNRYIYTDIKTSNSKNIRLNERRGKPGCRDEAIKTIPLGDAYYALEALKANEGLAEDKDFTEQYEWLFDRKFLDTWRNIAAFRNQAAHTGTIFSRENLEKNIELFSVLMEYMPKLVDLKRELAPDGYVDEIIADDSTIEPTKDTKLDTEPDKPRAPKKIAERYLYLEDLFRKCEFGTPEQDFIMDEQNDIVSKYSFHTIIFVDENGKQGMRDVLGNVLIPAKYDHLAFEYDSLFFPTYSMIAKRNDKLCLVKTDGSGKELTPPIYDDIDILPDFRGYLFKKDGSTSWGFMTNSGKEVTDCIIDGYSYAASLYFRSGNYWGMWQYGQLVAPLIYDNIEFLDPDEPLLFTLNGVIGYVRLEDSVFVPKSEIDAIEDEDERDDKMLEFVCDQYDVN